MFISQSINQFLSECVRGTINRDAFPEWPDSWNEISCPEDEFTGHVAFHGIALILASDPSSIENWPSAIRDWIRQQARLQTFWETSHKQALSKLFDALWSDGISTILTKGTALAYTLYPEPAMRRRGDSDLLIDGTPRDAVRAALARAGLMPVGDRLPLQESWLCHCRSGFAHVFDIHWRVNSSAAVSRLLERSGIGSRTIALDRLSQGAKSIAPTDNLILIAMNRALHGTFGYLTGKTKSFDQDRLIWALDLEFLCRSFSKEDWSQLLKTAEESGTARLVHSALEFAETVLRTQVPADIMAQLASLEGDHGLDLYISRATSLQRFKLDLAASRQMSEKMRLARHAAIPGREKLHDRFPDAQGWPIPLLHMRRIVKGLGKLLSGNA